MAAFAFGLALAFGLGAGSAWPVVRISDGRARIVEFRSVLNWCEEHGDLLLAHMRACGQMWYQRLERQVSGTATSEDQAPRVRS